MALDGSPPGDISDFLSPQLLYILGISIFFFSMHSILLLFICVPHSLYMFSLSSPGSISSNTPNKAILPTYMTPFSHLPVASSLSIYSCVMRCPLQIESWWPKTAIHSISAALSVSLTLSLHSVSVVFISSSARVSPGGNSHQHGCTSSETGSKW